MAPDVPLSPHDREVLRRLCGELAEAAALPVHAEKKALWMRLNRLQDVRPLVLIWGGQTPWHEFQDPWLRPQAEDRFARDIETRLRRTLYQWRHFPADMVLEPRVALPIRYHDTGFGLPMTGRRPEDAYGAASFEPRLHDERDLEKIRTPVLTPDWERTRAEHEALQAAAGDLVAVESVGDTGTGVPALWDLLVRWTGIEPLMRDMIDRPAFVHAAIHRLTEASLARLDQLEGLGLLALNNGNHLVSSGGLMFTDELPAPDFAGKVRTRDRWGNQMAQIFACVSPAMHEEFALRYEIRVLERFGLTSYGCCEPLDRKVPIVRKVPRLRRISMSPWVDWARGAEAIGRDFVYSAKPNPAVLAANAWDAGEARRDLAAILEATRGLHVELILKDIHTLRNDPPRLRAWERLAMAMAEASA